MDILRCSYWFSDFWKLLDAHGCNCPKCRDFSPKSQPYIATGLLALSYSNCIQCSLPLIVSPSQLPSCPPSNLICAPPSQNAGLEPSLTLKFDFSRLFLFKLITETCKHIQKIVQWTYKDHHPAMANPQYLAYLTTSKSLSLSILLQDNSEANPRPDVASVNIPVYI